jgi:hypothetical protein
MMGLSKAQFDALMAKAAKAPGGSFELAPGVEVTMNPKHQAHGGKQEVDKPQVDRTFAFITWGVVLVAIGLYFAFFKTKA